MSWNNNLPEPLVPRYILSISTCSHSLFFSLNLKYCKSVVHTTRRRYNNITLNYDILSTRHALKSMIVLYYIIILLHLYNVIPEDRYSRVSRNGYTGRVNTSRWATRRRRWLPLRPLFRLKGGRRSFRSSLSDVSCPVRQ